MWRGAISFGLVAIPVRLYVATESKSISFRLLCPTCHHPIKNRRWCPNENKEVGWNDALRGFEVGKDEFVVVEDKELEELPLNTTHTIDIVEFCADSDIEAGVYIKSAYYLEPEAVGVKPYVLLRDALLRSQKVAIGKIALRDREHLCRVALHQKGLLLNVLHWPDEIRDVGELSIPESDGLVHERELEMATMLIDNLSASFDPSRYHDDYREAVLALVDAKLHQQPLERPAPPQPAQVTDLMAALKASVEASHEKGRAQKTAAPAGDKGADQKRASAQKAEESQAEEAEAEVAVGAKRKTATATAARRRKAS